MCAPTPMDTDDDMDVDESFIGEADSAANVQVSQQMIEEIMAERDHLRELSRKLKTELANTQALADNRWGTIERLSTELQVQRRDLPSDLYTTVATGKVYHRSRNCYHIRTNSSVRTMKPCKDCFG